MKKTLSVLLATFILILSVTSVAASDCSHSYTETHVAANCSDKAHTVYTCDLCGDSYTVYDDEYTVPDGFYILAESVRDDSSSTLTLTLRIYNNPGIVAGRIRTAYNGDTLKAREFINGEVWGKNDYTMDVNIEKNPLSVLTEDYTTEDHCNTANGVYFTLVFDILDPDGSYDFAFTCARADFHDWNLTPHPPTIINIAGKAELGDHSYEKTTVAPTCAEDGYTSHTCIFCHDSYISETVEATGHSWEYSEELSAPTFTEEGLCSYICPVCNESKTESIPVLEHWKKGDLNGDDKLNSIDTNILKRLLNGIKMGPQAVDAADYDGNNFINSMDANKLQRAIAGLG